MSSIPSTSGLSPSAVHPACSDPGYVMTVEIGGSEYQVFAYTKAANGTKKYLPSTCDAQTVEKIRSLISGLLNAHDARRTSLNEATYELKALDSTGLIKPDDTTVSHDFLIQPISTPIADQMASTLSLAGYPMQAAAIKAKDIWTTMEEMIRHEIERSSSHPDPSTNHTPSNTTPPASSTPSNDLMPPTTTVPPQSQTLDPQLPVQDPMNSSTPNNPVSMIQPYRAPMTATDWNLRGLDLEQPDWYERIPNRAKLRIVNDILDNRCTVGGIYEKVWKLFETKAGNNPSSTVIGLLTQEKKQLSIHSRALPSSISFPIRREAAQIISAHQQYLAEEELQEKILSLMEKEFERKEQLFECIREQAESEGVMIADWDQKWAHFHYIESSYRFIQALARWLDNN